MKTIFTNIGKNKISYLSSRLFSQKHRNVKPNNVCYIIGYFLSISLLISD
jgi:hypothetical protein